MVAIIWMILVVAICWFSPWWIGALVWFANLFIPDLVPFVDELLSTIGPIRNWIKTAKVVRGAKHFKDKIYVND